MSTRPKLMTTDEMHWDRNHEHNIGWRAAGAADLRLRLNRPYGLSRHCEEQRDEAIHWHGRLDCSRLRSLSYGGQVAALAMTDEPFVVADSHFAQ